MVVSFVVSGCEGSEVLAFLKEALDLGSLPVNPWAGELRRDLFCHRPDIVPGATIPQRFTRGITVVTAVGEKNVPDPDAAEYVRRRAPVMRLTLGQLEADRALFGAYHRMDLRRQPATRATYATGSLGFFGLLATC